MTKITEPGVYDIPMDVYHSDCCDGPSVSGSVLWQILNECPASVWETSYLNPRRVEEEDSRTLNFGKAAHALALGEPEFAANFVICPHDKLNANPGKQWNDAWKQAVADGTETRTLVRAADFRKIQAMTAALRRSPQVGGAFTGGKPEQSLIWRDAETGIWLKSRPDYLPDNPATAFLQQYKTCLTIKPRKLNADVFKYGYHLGAALEVDGVRDVMHIEPLGIAHIVQEKEAPYLADLRMFDADQIDYGRRLYRRALRIFAGCWERHLANKPERVAWPGYTDSPQYFETPYYIQKEMENTDGDDSGSNEGNDEATDDDGGDDAEDPGRVIRAG